VLVEDPFRRYIQTAFRVELPLLYTGVFLSRAADSPPQRFPRFILFSAPTRTTPFGTAVIRGELIDMTSDRPAGHALVRVREPAGHRWYGLADEAGRFSLFMPYPQLIGTFSGSPRIFIGQPLNEQTWELVVEVLYEPALLAPLPHTRLPEYLNILSQNPARIWMDLSDEESPLGSGSAIFELPATLAYGRELTLRTEGLSKLAISPAKSPL
jgi:hypothetical protein